MAYVYNVEDNVQTALLGQDLDSRAPLRHHHSAWIRLPTRLIIKIKEVVSPLPVALWLIARAFLEFVWRQKKIVSLLAVTIAVVVAGILLSRQGSQDQTYVLLLLLFGYGMILLAIIGASPFHAHSIE